MKSKKAAGEDGGGVIKTTYSAPPSIEIVEHRGVGSLGNGGGGSITFTEPWREITPGPGTGSSDRRGGREPPEKRLTLFALRLAVLEKAASGVGKLDFLWATVVLLGGFASDLKITDFWCVTVILVGEGARVFIRSRELEWQHHATITSTAGDALRISSRLFRRVAHAIFNFKTPRASLARVRALQFQRRIVATMKRRTWHAPDVTLLPYTGWVFVSNKISRLLNWLQVLSAFVCVALSVWRLWKRKGNMRPALLLFYTLALLEASLFLLEKSYWWWKMSVCKLLDQVSGECELGPYGLVSLKRFFYDAYSQCIEGSIFDGIKMDLVTFAEELILSGFLDEQLIGVRILQQLATSKGSARDSDTLRKLGTNPRSIERVVDMLSWKRPDEEEVRQCAAEVVSTLAGKRQNALRVSAIPGAMESIMSLLYGRGAPTASASAEARVYDYLQFNLLGLRILKKLAKDHDNCGKIGNARGLLAKIVEFSHASPALLCNTSAPDSQQVRAVKRALQVIKMLVYTTAATGKALRRDVAENVFTVSSLRVVLQNGHQHMELQKLAMDILTGMAMDQRANEMIVGTGGVVKLLLSMFFNAQPALELGREAGEALEMLALESKASCSAILKTRSDVIDPLVSALEGHDARCLSAMRLLRNLCAYSGEEHRTRLSAVTKAMPAVLGATITGRDKILEVSVGLTTQICNFMDGEQFAAELRGAGLDERAYVQRLAGILRHYKYPVVNVPRMRRFVVQQLVWLMTSSGCGRFVELLRDRELGMELLLEAIADTTSEVECYHVFSGSVPISKHRESFSAIVETALQLLAGGDAAAGGGGASFEFG